MSRAGTISLQERDNRQKELSSRAICSPQWNELMNISTVSDVPLADTFTALNPEIYNMPGIQARAIAALYRIAQQLSQTTVTSVHFLQAVIHPQPEVEDEDIWIEMPPLSVRKVIFNVQRMGRGEPLAFPDEFVDE